MPYKDPEKRKEMARLYGQRWRAANPGYKRNPRPLQTQPSRQAHAAHQAVQRALLKGVITRPSTCAQCGTDGFIEASHQDYSQPLAIEWLCRRCHRIANYHTPAGGTVPKGSLPPGRRPNGSGPIHGTITGYSYYLCRCQDCRAAWAANSRRRRLAQT